jgi:hypothetical protein
MPSAEVSEPAVRALIGAINDPPKGISTSQAQA